MNLMTQPLEFSAAYMRAATYILNSNMRVAQVVMKASVEGNLALMGMNRVRYDDVVKPVGKSAAPKKAATSATPRSRTTSAAKPAAKAPAKRATAKTARRNLSTNKQRQGKRSRQHPHR